MTNLLSRVCQTVDDYLALGNEIIDVPGARFVRNAGTPGRFDSNHAGLVRTSRAEEIDGLIQRADIEFPAPGHRCFVIDALTPAEFIARLLLSGVYSHRGTDLHLVLEGELRASAPSHEIREMLTAADWDAYRALRELDYAEDDEKHGRARPVEEARVRERVAYVRAKTPGVRFWLAYAGNKPVAYLNSWPGNNGVGQVEDLFTHPQYRHRGIATALIRHGVEDVRDRGAGPVVITADPEDTPKHMYAAMGFEPTCVSQRYVRFVSR